MSFLAGNVAPKRLMERDAPGLAGTGYWDLVQMAEEMHARDPKMRYDSLRIIGDEIWNFTDGVRSVNDIADAVGPSSTSTWSRGMYSSSFRDWPARDS